MLSGTDPDPDDARVMDVCLILHAEHGMNASTFAARVTAATLSDIHSAVTSAVGTLKGPLHGGANQAVMNMLFEIDKRGVAPADHVHELLVGGKRVMGFGHRVYKTMDPRPILRAFSKDLGERAGDPRWYRMSEEILETMRREKGLYPNVDFFSPPPPRAGIPADLFTPIFAIARERLGRARRSAVRAEPTHPAAREVRGEARPPLRTDRRARLTAASFTPRGCRAPDSGGVPILA